MLLNMATGSKGSTGVVMYQCLCQEENEIEMGCNTSAEK